MSKSDDFNKSQEFRNKAFPEADDPIGEKAEGDWTVRLREKWQDRRLGREKEIWSEETKRAWAEIAEMFRKRVE